MTEDVAAGKKKLYSVLPDEIQEGHYHGQFLMDVPGMFINFACENEDELYRWARELDEFLRDPDRAMLEIESPHLPGRNFLTRYGASKIVGVNSAWSKKVRPKVTGSGIEIVPAWQ